MKCFSLFDRDYRSGNLSSTPNTSFSCQTSIRPSNICIIRSVFFKPSTADVIAVYPRIVVLAPIGEGNDEFRILNPSGHRDRLFFIPVF